MSQKNSFNKQELLSMANGDMFGQDNAKLPLEPMLMIDRILNISKEGGAYDKGSILAEMDITEELWFFHCHFKGDPVMPGCLGLDALWQMAGFYLAWLGCPGRGRALGCGEVKFTGQVTPKANLVTYQLDIKRTFQKKTKLIIADGKLTCDSKEIYTAKNLKVGLFHPDEIDTL